MQPPVPVLSEFYTLARIGAPRTFTVEMQSTKHRFTTRCSSVTCRINLPGWRWARIMQLALVWSSSSSHSEACKALGGPSGSLTAQFLAAAARVRAAATPFCLRRNAEHQAPVLGTLLRITYWVSQRSLHNEPIFRLLLKVAVNGTH